MLGAIRQSHKIQAHSLFWRHVNKNALAMLKRKAEGCQESETFLDLLAEHVALSTLILCKIRAVRHLSTHVQGHNGIRTFITLILMGDRSLFSL